MKALTIFCTNCGAANPMQAKFCFSCGESFDELDKTTIRATQAAEQLKPGKMLRQRYRVLKQIGQGGFGAVYKAEDTELGQRLLAIKEMSQQGLSQQDIDEGIAAFKREALMLAGLMHEHLPRIYDHFEENERWYLVMDYIEGETLEDRFNKSRDGSLPLIMALQIALQLCDVLDYLHTRQPPIIFRDLKPANIILTPTGDLFLIDFGIARHFKPGQARDTIAFGSPGYAAPEQYGKAQTTTRADIYSLGAILHQMLSGDDPSLSPFRFAPLAGQDPALQRLVMSMLEMDESKRPASVTEVRQVLQRIKDQPVSPVPMPPRPGQLLPAAPLALHLPAIPAPAPFAPKLVYEHHYGFVRAVAWSPDSLYATSATDAIVRVWNAQSGQNLCSYREHLGVIKHMARSPGDTRIASISEENKVHIWDGSTGKTAAIYPGDPKPGFSPNIGQLLAWSSDGAYLAVAGTRYINIWATDQFQHRVIARIRSKAAFGFHAICWAPDGQSLAATQANNVIIYRLGAKMKTSYYRYNAQVCAVAWSPDGKYLASGGYDRVVHIWDIQNDRFIGAYQGHSQPISALAWSPDSRRIVSGSLATSVNIWDALTGQPIITYHAYAGDVLTLAWSPDGRSILSGGSDRKVYVWRAP
jgi:serine/threonine protein kinase